MTTVSGQHDLSAQMSIRTATTTRDSNYNAETTGEQLKYNADHWHDLPKQKISASVKLKGEIIKRLSNLMLQVV